ncbi:peptidoglycan DD-metalloendopeptidase family protein [Lacibacterium aquatile]|uniref:Peptidoglycan DD-metalloendopeptidase family protein n=1 Tax=Lacibacterium aquatile TaxID=1168082 RepID=A0ABW5DNB8_9PROT
MRKRLHILSLSSMLLVAGCDSVQDYFGRAPDEPVRPSVVVPPSAVKGSYIVQRGDTVYQLARDQNVPVRAIIEANRLEAPYILLIGQRLEIPRARTHTVARGETLYAVSRKYGVDVSSLVKSNNIPAPYVLKVGQTLTLPAGVATEDGKAPPASPPLVASAPPQPISSVPVASGAQTGSSIEVAPLAPPTSANATANPTVVPATPAPVTTAPVPATPAPQPQPAVAPPQPVAPAPVTVAPAPVTQPAPATASTPAAAPTPITPPTPAKPPEPAKVEPPASPAPAVAAAPSPEVAKPTEPATPVPSVEPPATPATPKPKGDTVAVLATPPARGGRTFQWPVTGRVIATYGEMGSGLRNDGLNIAANKGTPVRAAENGVVVYAGDEIKGFGNLLLIRHADGFTTAYAHCDALLVNRGDTIRRGQVIARVGDTGHVSRPQLHFEIRKGTQAVDPQEYLSRPNALLPGSVPGETPTATAPPAG